MFQNLTSQIIRKKSVSILKILMELSLSPFHSCGKNGFSLKNLVFFLVSDPSNLYLTNVFYLHVFYQATENMFFEFSV